MPVYEYRGQRINITDEDTEYKGYFDAARERRLVVKRCLDCGLLRGEPGPGCPWCPSLKWEWREVSGKGTIHSYQIVAHTVIPDFREWAAIPDRAGGTGRAERPALSPRRACVSPPTC